MIHIQYKLMQDAANEESPHRSEISNEQTKEFAENIDIIFEKIKPAVH